AIDQAALRRMSKVRQHQIGPHSDQSQEILSELARARLILMDPDRRTDYDAKLRARGETRPGSLVAREKVGNGDAPSDRSAPDEDAPDVLASLALTEQAVDGPASLPRPRSASRRPTLPVVEMSQQLPLSSRTARKTRTAMAPLVWGRPRRSPSET